MALGVGSIITQKPSSGDLPLGPEYVPQPPRFGKIIGVADPGWSVLWQLGVVQANLPTDAYDDLYSVSPAERSRLWGQVVHIVNESPEYQAIVTSMFRRSDAAAAERAVIFSLNGRGWREVNCADLVVVAGR